MEHGPGLYRAATGHALIDLLNLGVFLGVRSDSATVRSVQMDYSQAADDLAKLVF